MRLKLNSLNRLNYICRGTVCFEKLGGIFIKEMLLGERMIVDSTVELRGEEHVEFVLHLFFHLIVEMVGFSDVEGFTSDEM